MTARWIRRFKTQSQGRFNCWLVSHETMRDALNQLLANTERYIMVIRQPRTNWQTGKSQDTGLTLFESDSIDLTSAIDPRLLRSRRIVRILSDKKNGTA